jgi:hypothetical protein
MVIFSDQPPWKIILAILMPHFRFVDVRCPWPGCTLEIELIDFCFELQGQELHDRGLAAWQQSHPFVGRCPGCKKYVEFGQKAKSCVVGDPAAQGAFILPDDWYEHAILIDPNGDIVRGSTET